MTTNLPDDLHVPIPADATDAEAHTLVDKAIDAAIDKKISKDVEDVLKGFKL